MIDPVSFQNPVHVPLLLLQNPNMLTCSPLSEWRSPHLYGLSVLFLAQFSSLVHSCWSSRLNKYHLFQQILNDLCLAPLLTYTQLRPSNPMAIASHNISHTVIFSSLFSLPDELCESKYWDLHCFLSNNLFCVWHTPDPGQMWRVEEIHPKGIFFWIPAQRGERSL